MVPDVKYNEAYISFLFVHPEWRRAGIATFMIYHLIQVCCLCSLSAHLPLGFLERLGGGGGQRQVTPVKRSRSVSLTRLLTPREKPSPPKRGSLLRPRFQRNQFVTMCSKWNEESTTSGSLKHLYRPYRNCCCSWNHHRGDSEKWKWEVTFSS